MSFIFLFVIIINIICYEGTLGVNFTVVNDCGFTVWPAISSGDLNTTGFELSKGTSRSFQVSSSQEEMSSISIWGRTGCTFNGSGSGSCATGDCGSGQMECNSRTTVVPTPPVTVAYFIFKSPYYSYDNNLYNDNSYNVSIINGYNLPMTIEPTGELSSCLKTGCADDLNQRCPPELKLKDGEGCKSACQVYPSQYECCISCDPKTTSGRLFHLACPKSVTYQYDEMDNTQFCNASDYTIRFCPPADTFSTIKLGGQLKYDDRLVSIGGNFTLGFLMQ